MQESEPDQTAPDWESLGGSGVLLSRYEQDQQALLDQLAVFLEATLTRQTSVRRTRGVIGPRRTTGLAVQLGGIRYNLEQGQRSVVEATRTRIVRGVAVRTEPLSVEAWLAELSAALASELERTTG